MKTTNQKTNHKDNTLAKSKNRTKKCGLNQLEDLYFKLMPKVVLLVKNKERYEEVQNAIKEITELASKVCENAKITAYQDQLTGSSICVKITTDLIEISEIDKFCTILKKANNFEIYPLTNGKLAIGLVFQNAFKPAPPIDNI